MISYEMIHYHIVLYDAISYHDIASYNTITVYYCSTWYNVESHFKYGNTIMYHDIIHVIWFVFRSIFIVWCFLVYDLVQYHWIFHMIWYMIKSRIWFNAIYYLCNIVLISYNNVSWFYRIILYNMMW